jgi:ketosteroid isomerase-like protein
MSNREVAMNFLRRFCAGDVDGLALLLAEDLQFAGPFHQFNSRADYLDVLRQDPPETGGYRVLSVTESGDSVSIFYDHETSDRAITIAQWFRFRGEKISEMRLVFDTRGFA